jgi:hypothetical protein
VGDLLIIAVTPLALPALLFFGFCALAFVGALQVLVGERRPKTDADMGES